MKIAAVTEDGTTISQHFGRAPLYEVTTIEDGKIVHKETRDKTGHHTFAAHDKPDLAHGQKHGRGAGAQVRHSSMAETITDCQVLIAGGMGWGAYESLKSHNIIPLLTDIENVDEAVRLYLEGKLTNQEKLLH